MIYELSFLSLQFGVREAVLADLDRWSRSPVTTGTLLGCWLTEFGPLNELILLRRFASRSAMLAERQQIRTSATPFGCTSGLRRFRFEGYRAFPFLPPVVASQAGPVFEIRTYRLKPGGAQPTIAAWAEALPGRLALSPLTIAMTAIEGPPRFVQIWPYPDLASRAAIRDKATEGGIWPPKGALDWLTGEMTSTLAHATAISPVR